MESRCRENLPLSGTSVNSNPYDSPTSTEGVLAKPRGARNLLHIVVLGFVFLLTLIFALVNSVGEQLPSLSFTLGVTVAATISQVPGILVGFLSSRATSRTITAFLFPAYLVAATGMLAYLNYAFNGKADSLDSAAHMHVIMFPILHCTIAVVAYLLTALLVAVVSLVMPKR